MKSCPIPFPMEWEKLSVNHISDKDLIPIIEKNLCDSLTTTTTTKNLV